MGFLSYLGHSLASIILVLFGGLLILMALVGFSAAPLYALTQVGANASQEAIQYHIFIAQVGSGILGLIGLVLIISAGYLRRKVQIGIV